MKSAKQKKEMIIDVLFGVLLLGVIVNIISPKIQSAIESKIKERFPNAPNAYVIFCVTALVIIVLLYYLLKKTLSKHEDTPAAQTHEDRASLIESLGKRYDGLLRSKMENDLKLGVQLEMKYTKEGHDEEYVKEYFFDGYAETSTDDYNQLFEDYETKILRLLILGEPGAGKSTLLLRYAQKLLANAKADTNYPIPIILNLSSWRNEHNDFKNWLEQSLVFFAGEHGTTKENAKLLANSDNLILLLDGLDEIPIDYTESCLEKLTVYIREYLDKREGNYPKTIICCRTKEYGELNMQVPRQGTLSIEPLTAEKVDAELGKIIANNKDKSNPALKLKKQLEKYPNVKLFLTTAFHLRIALLHVQNECGFESINNQEDLVRTYIEQEMHNLSKEYPEKQAKKTLQWLSHKMNNNKKGLTFELVDVQPNWLKHKWIYILLFSLFFSIGIGVVMSLIPFWSYEQTFSRDRFNYFGFNAFIIVFFVLLFYPHIRPSEIRIFNTKMIFTRQTILYLFYTQFIAIIATIVLAIILSLQYEEILIGDLLWLFIMLGCTMFLYVIIEQAFSNIRRYPVIVKPYKRLFAPYFFEAISSTIIMFIMAFPMRIKFEDNTLLSILYCVLYSIIVGFSVSTVINPLPRHLTVRLILILEKSTPVFFVNFLNKVSEETGFMERNGGEWRFRHKLIFDEFCKRDSLPPPNVEDN